MNIKCTSLKILLAWSGVFMLISAVLVAASYCRDCSFWHQWWQSFSIGLAKDSSGHECCGLVFSCFACISFAVQWGLMRQIDRKFWMAQQNNNKSLESWIWGAAFSILGVNDAPEYKDFTLPLIFTKCLCYVFDDEIITSRRKSVHGWMISSSQAPVINWCVFSTIVAGRIKKVLSAF